MSTLSKTSISWSHISLKLNGFKYFFLYISHLFFLHLWLQSHFKIICSSQPILYSLTNICVFILILYKCPGKCLWFSLILINVDINAISSHLSSLNHTLLSTEGLYLVYPHPFFFDVRSQLYSLNENELPFLEYSISLVFIKKSRTALNTLRTFVEQTSNSLNMNYF